MAGVYVLNTTDKFIESESLAYFRDAVTASYGDATSYKYVENVGTWTVFTEVAPDTILIYEITKGTAEETTFLSDRPACDAFNPSKRMKFDNVHASTHSNGENDEIDVANLGASSSDTAASLSPNGTGGVQWTTNHALKATENQRWSDSSQQRQELRNAADGYTGDQDLSSYALDVDLTTVDNREAQHWNDSSQQRQELRNAADGYATSTDLTIVDSREAQHWVDSSTQRQDIRDVLDGYAENDGYGVFVIWAEEGGPLSDNSFEWSFGNGATGDTGITMAIEAELFAITLHLETIGTGTEIAIIKNSYQVATTGLVNGLSSVTTLNTTVSFTAGDIISFKTIIGGGADEARISAWFRIPITPVSTLLIGDLLDVTSTGRETGDILAWDGATYSPSPYIQEIRDGYVSKNYMPKVPISYIVNYGSGVTGTISDVAVWADGNIIYIGETEDGANMSIEIDFTFTGVTSFYGIGLSSSYDGSNNHWIDTQVYDYTNTTWRTLASTPNRNGGFDYQYTPMPVSLTTIEADYISGGEVLVRLKHPKSGNILHFFEIDHITLLI